MTGSFETSVRIEAPPADVFAYLVDTDLVRRWMGGWGRLDAVPGGAVALDINGVPIRGEYVVVDPPHRVVFTWGVAGSESLPPGSTTVEITLRDEAGGTRLDLVHRDLPDEEAPRHATGWAHYLGRLAVAGIGGDPGPDPWASA